MKKYSTYIFDVDGTLIDTAELIFQCFLYSCRYFADIEVTREIVFPKIGLPFKAQLEHYIGPTDDNRVLNIFEKHMAYQRENYQKYLKVFNDVPETLQELRNCGCKLAIATSRKRDSLLPFLKETNILDYFDGIVTPEDTNLHKPNPEPVHKALEITNSHASESIYIGDSVFDIESGYRAGCDTAFVSWSVIHESECHIRPGYVLKSMKELINW